jgi:hypothetical protein
MAEQHIVDRFVLFKKRTKNISSARLQYFSSLRLAASPVLGRQQLTLREAEQRFLLLFLEKEECA